MTQFTTTSSDDGRDAHPTSDNRSARLALEDGAVFRGVGFGATSRVGVRTGEVVFNTAMTGYQEALTDPSYTGQILVMTAPMIGNYGVNDEDVESGRVHVAGFIVHELARRHSNYRATADVSSYLAGADVLGIQGVDTRALTRRLRASGSMRAAITNDPSLSDHALVELARNAPAMTGQNLVPLVGSAVSREWTEALTFLPGEQSLFIAPSTRSAAEYPESAAARQTPLRVLALDCGAKRNIFRNLLSRGCAVTVSPHTLPAAEIRARWQAGDINGLFLSNGPGDPAAVEETIATLRALLDDDMTEHLPIFGICLGHQLLAIALGATTYKLKFGHHGVNHPVRNALNGRVEITSQNHGFAVDEASMTELGGVTTHINLNDGSLAGFRLTDRPVFAVQHHPEAGPGPHDAGSAFDTFIDMMATRTPAGEASTLPVAL